MFSFKSLALFSAFAFGAISSVAAAPLEGSNNLLARCGCSSAPAIVTDLTATLSVHVDELSAYMPGQPWATVSLTGSNPCRVHHREQLHR